MHSERKNIIVIKLITILIIITLAASLKAQFYNGLQMPFGKNRVQYNDFFWSFYRFKNFDVYFNEGGKDIARYTSYYVNAKLSEIQNFFNFRLEKRLIFIVFNKLTDFRQSNIGLISTEEDDNIGGVNKILENKVILYFEGNYKNFEIQINQAIAEVILKEMLTGNSIRDRVTNLTQLNLPDWYIYGLTSYMANKWDFNLDNQLRDGILSKKYKKFTRLTDKEAIIAGHSFWRYIAETYGESIIPSIVYLTRVNKNANRGFYNVLGIKLKPLIKEWYNYYKAEYEIETQDKDIPETSSILKKPKTKRTYQNIKISPDKKNIIYSTNENGKCIIWLYNTDKNRKKRIFKYGYVLKQITDYSYPILSWHLSGKIFAFIIERDGVIKLYLYNLEERQLISRNLLFYNKVLDFSYAQSGTAIVLSAIVNGKTDIFVYNIPSGSSEQITNDFYDDLNPKFINNSNSIIFSSNRDNDTLNFNDDLKLKEKHNFQIFLYDYASQSPVLRRLTNIPNTENLQPVEVNRDTFVFLSNESGIINKYFLHLDSTISFIDTAIHYSYISEIKPLTNYSRNILYHDVRKNENTEIIHYNKKDRLFLNTLNFDTKVSPAKTNFRLTFNHETARADSIKEMKRRKARKFDILPDSLLKIVQDSAIYKESDIDINKYVFEREKRYTFDKNLKPVINYPSDNKNSIVNFPLIRVYQTAFYTNYFVDQIDFGFLNKSYQPFNGNLSYYEPDLNGLFKIGTYDLFEDYRIVGGIRISSDLVNNEYMMSFENLKKRLDKEVLFHRQVTTILNQSEDIIKNISSNFYIKGKYPFDQVKSTSVSLSFRQDKIIFLSIDKKSLLKQNINNYWANINANYVFDNVISRGINLYNGTRYKFFAEVYKQLNKKNTFTTIIGFDFRHYQPIFRDLIYAGRFAASTSFGTAHLLYYLGSVDNCINSPRDTSNNIMPGINYVFQTIATNMRGFPQNARAGTSFFVINNEIRWPIIRFFSNYPVSSKFWSNLQLIGFYDIGSAWPSNDMRIITRGPITVIMDLDRDPIINGFGYGIRFPLLGYYLRIDKGFGIEKYKISNKIIYISLGTDF